MTFFYGFNVEINISHFKEELEFFFYIDFMLKAIMEPNISLFVLSIVGFGPVSEHLCGNFKHALHIELFYCVVSRKKSIENCHNSCYSPRFSSCEKLLQSDWSLTYKWCRECIRIIHIINYSFCPSIKLMI